MPWFINNNLKDVVGNSRSIVGLNVSECCYAPSDPHEGDNAPYPLTSGAQVTTAIVKVNGLLFGRFHTISHSAYKPPETPLLAVKALPAFKKSKPGLVVLDIPKLKKVVEEHQVGPVSDEDAGKILQLMRYQQGGEHIFREDIKKHREARKEYESKKAALLQRHPYAPGEEGGFHAEDAFLSAWTAFKKEPIYKEIKEAAKGQLYVSLKLAKTPCEKCTDRLIKFVQDEKEVKLRIKAQRIYFESGETLGAGVTRMQKLIAKGIPVKAWAIEDRVKTKSETKQQQLHELSYWNFDPLDPKEQLFLNDLKEKLKNGTTQMNNYLDEIKKDGKKYDAKAEYKSASRSNPQNFMQDVKIVIN